MKADVEQIADRAMHLSPEDRLALAERLWASVDAPEQSAIGRVWADEIERRIDDLESGKVKPVPAEEVFARIERKLRSRGK